MEVKNTLKGKINPNGDPYWIKLQKPEELIARDNYTQHKIKEIKEKNNQTQEQTQKIRYEVKAGKLFINGMEHKQQITPPTVADVLNLQTEDMERISSIDSTEGRSVKDKGSKFTAYALITNNNKRCISKSQIGPPIGTPHNGSL